MDFCPEVAVLQSAFHLIDQQAKGQLSNLSKDKCCQYVEVISASVEEICTGLEYDLDIEMRKLWQQKLHCLLFHTVVKNFYSKNEDGASDTRIPVQSSLDILSQLLPVFSCEFYFELIKQCDWMSNFLQCLQCLDLDTSSTFLSDLLAHCKKEPITATDHHTISVLSETILARCMCVPDTPGELCKELLNPIIQPRKFVTLAYPDSDYVDDDRKICSTEGITSDDIKTEKQSIGVQLFDEFVKNQPDILNLMFSNYEKALDCCMTSSEHGYQEQLDQILLQLAFWYYFYRTGKDNSFIDWFVNNVYVAENYNQSGLTGNEKNGESLRYSLNFVLIESLCCNVDDKKLRELIEKALQLFKRSEKRSDNSCNNVKTLCGLSVNTCVLLRMLNSIMGKDYSQDSHAGLEEVFQPDSPVDGSYVLLGETWNSDITLGALLWRVEKRLPPYQVCIDRLLEEKCLQFWASQSLPSMMIEHSDLLSRVDQVTKLSKIFTSLVQSSQPRETTMSIFNLIQTVFQQLSFPDQDCFVRELYCSGNNYLSEVIKDGIDDKVTNTLNKVTVDLNDKVLHEIMWLCIGDPEVVLNATLRLSMDSDQQAASCSQIIRLLHSTCRCCHPKHHDDVSLIAYCVQRFLLSQNLTSKQQNNFLVLLSELMLSKTKSPQGPVLSPSEFMFTMILPLLSAESVGNRPGELSCEFNINLLLAALVSYREVTLDDYKLKIEPLPLIVTLAEIYHECLVCLENDGEEKMTTLTCPKSRPHVTMATKLNIRELVQQCYTVVIQLIEKQGFEMQREDILWILEMTGDLHPMVKFGLCDVMDACGFYEYRTAWDVALVTCMEDFVTNLTTILQFVAMDRGCIKSVIGHLRPIHVSNNQLIDSLVQVLPLCSSSGFENIWTFMEELIASGVVYLTVMYKFLSTSYLPLVDYTVLKPSLQTSQLFMYTMMTLSVTLKQTSQTAMSMLQPVITSYSGCLKERCGQVTSDNTNSTVSLIYLCELFHQVCQVTTYLTEDVTDTALILLLHVLTQYITVRRQQQRTLLEEWQSDDLDKLKNNVENGMFKVISSLPGTSEAKRILCKKLKE